MKYAFLLTAPIVLNNVSVKMHSPLQQNIKKEQ